MKLSPDTKIIRRAAEGLRRTDIGLSIPQAVHKAYMALEVIRDAEYRVQDDYYDSHHKD